jgi:hypothetical protein
VTKQRAGHPGFDSRQERPEGLTQPPVELVFPREKAAGREANHSLPYSFEIKNEWSYIFTPPYVCMPWCLVKALGTILPSPYLVSNPGPFKY